MIQVCLHSSPCTLTASPSLVLLPCFQDCHSPHHLHYQETHWSMLWYFLLACIPDFCLVVAGLGMNRVCLLLTQSTKFQPLPSQGSPKYSMSPMSSLLPLLCDLGFCLYSISLKTSWRSYFSFLMLHSLLIYSDTLDMTSSNMEPMTEIQERPIFLITFTTSTWVGGLKKILV